MSSRTPSSLSSGSRLGPYEIVAPLGAGGMGEVYRARDSRLGREVAVKVLPAHLIGDAEVRARFEREARSVSSLNHPHICVLHDVGRQGDTDYLVMELVEGETLAGRITRGPLPIADVLRIGSQIADALSKAHRAGVIHRDLKPANVMLTKSGAKLMDFGLARAGGRGGVDGLTQAPTAAAHPVTAQGTILGTFQYMAPEQLEAREADARTDIWALGCVLYEMATGKRPFEGGTSASLISAILRDTPRPMAELAPLSPPAFERVVKQCLAKDPDDRWQSAGDLKRELEWIAGEGGAAPVIAGAPHGNRRAIGFIGLAMGALALAASAWLVMHRATPPPATDSAIAPPPGVEFVSSMSHLLPLAISSDGRWIVFAGHRTDGVGRLWIRSLSDADARELPGTERGEGPFFSPDGRSLGFFSMGKLKRIDIDGGLVTTLADAPDPRGGSWGSNGSIVFAPTGTAPLYRVSESGGSPVAITALDSALNEATHRYPHMLPDGRHFLYLARRSGAGGGRNPTIFVGDLKTGTRSAVLEVASNVAYASGHLLYVRQRALIAQPYDPRRNRLHGRPHTVMADVTTDERFSRSSFAVSGNGVLLAMAGREETRRQLRWRTRNGQPLDTVGEPADYAFGGVASVSPDGRNAAIAIVNPGRGNADVWILDLASGRSRRLTAGTDDHFACIWSHDGRSIITASGSPAMRYIASRPVQGLGGTRRIVELTRVSALGPLSQSPDGALLCYLNTTSAAIWIVRGSAAEPLFPDSLPGNRYGGQFSNDGRFVVYDSDESGRFEVYVTPFPWTGERWQVSRDGGWGPRWSRNGRELLFVDADNRLTSVEVSRTANGLEFGTIHPLFSLPLVHNNPAWVFDEAPDGRILVSERPTGSGGPQARLLTNWTAKLDAR